jgi:hypothetical protein
LVKSVLLPVLLPQLQQRPVRRQPLDLDPLVVVLEAVQPAAVAQVAAMPDQLQPSTPLTRNTRTVVEAAEIAGRFGSRSG